MEEKSEKILYSTRTEDNREITVTNSRLIVPVGNTQKTYSVAHINSVIMAQQPRSNEIWKVILGFAFFGSICFYYGSTEFNGMATLIGVILLCISGGLFYVSRPKHYVYISVVGEDTPTYGSHNIELVKEITNAINQALISRG